MEGSFLSAAEQRYYPLLFSKSDSESSGRVTVQRAMNLFRSSPQLTDDVIQKINEVCGGERLGYYGRSQFYCALKMIAMVQNGLPLPSSVDFVMQAGMEVPLPEFGDETTSNSQDEQDASRMEFENPAFTITDMEFKLKEGKGGSTPRGPPLKPIRPPNSNAYSHQQTAQPPSNATQPPHTPTSPPVSPRQSPPPVLTAHQATPAGPRSKGSLERNQSLPASITLDEEEEEGAETQSPMATARLEKQASAPHPSLKSDEGWASFERTVDDEGQDTSWARFPPPASPSSSCSSTSEPASSHHTSESPIDSQSGEAPDHDEADAEMEVNEDGDEDDDDDDDDDHEEEDEDKGSREVDGGVVEDATRKTKDGHGDGEHEDEDEEDVWRINSEQTEYYTKQFQMLQPEPTGLLPGSDAKVFFEKSKLPTEELSKIWQLSDVNKDGTLSLGEFCTAMHLVVLRKHNIPLPDELPNCLIPKIPSYNGDADAVTAGPKKTTPVPIPGTTTTIHPIQPHVHTGRSVTPPSSGSEMKNADDDAKIFQPIALHLSPDGKPVQPDGEGTEVRPRTFSDPGHPDESAENSIAAPSSIKPRAMTLSHGNSTDHTPSRIVPPPEWDKSSSVTSPRPVIPPRPTPQQLQQSKTLSMDASSEHDFADFSKIQAMKTKSSSLKIDRKGVSLDYSNRLSEQTFPPVPPPRPSASASEEDLVDEKDEEVTVDGVAGRERLMAGEAEAEVADRRREQFSKERTRHVSAPVPLGVAELRSGDRKLIQSRIRLEKEENTKLSRHNSEMQQELRTLTDQRLALEIQLERLRPFSNTAS